MKFKYANTIDICLINHMSLARLCCVIFIDTRCEVWESEAGPLLKSRTPSPEPPAVAPSSPLPAPLSAQLTADATAQHTMSPKSTSADGARRTRPGAPVPTPTPGASVAEKPGGHGGAHISPHVAPCHSLQHLGVKQWLSDLSGQQRGAQEPLITSNTTPKRAVLMSRVTERGGPGREHPQMDGYMER